MKLEADVTTLIDNWHVCPYNDPVDELFEMLRLCTGESVLRGPLDTVSIIDIVKDLRECLNPHGNVNLFHFTDIICDAILLKFEGMEEESLPEFVDFTQECESRAFMGA